MKYVNFLKMLSVLIVFVFFMSCDSGNASKYNDQELRTRIVSLEKRLDSLTRLTHRTAASFAPQKKNKKGLKIATVPFAENYPVETIQTIEYATPPQRVVEPSSYRSTQATTSSQCMAITKKGSRCLRNVRSGGYCWQHGG